MSEVVYFELAEDALPLELPLMACPVPAGFPSPADGYSDQTLDLHRYLFERPASTFLAQVTGDSMLGAGINPDDFIVVNRAITPVDGHIVVAVVEGEHTVKRLRQENGRMWLEAANERYPALELPDDYRFEIWGVVTHVIHPFMKKKTPVAAWANQPRKWSPS
ncbi:LexA family protein [Hymenobacter jejuensis]|uniref:Translesion error-prone DNA polymerase V autoproteolytic subunit n=1 Tax=Hymenobacter jejuensis TaxID=2502781 RepID=A0A5B7ZVE5_9BACT|nr:translesion error-prone DNA polymerase V autoproteolytic subunit [Hymenobacter jejuensis]QDA59061.1 translesion error-prone DNA polymerase V autoproteolytic subunit [Hymenobacter jejuensis]